MSACVCGAVSYTHLDVYKRQSIERVGVVAVDIDLGEHRKTDAIVRLAETRYFASVARFLRAEWDARET